MFEFVAETGFESRQGHAPLTEGKTASERPAGAFLCHPVAMTAWNKMGTGYVRVRSDLTSDFPW